MYPINSFGINVVWMYTHEWVYAWEFQESMYTHTYPMGKAMGYPVLCRENVRLFRRKQFVVEL